MKLTITAQLCAKPNSHLQHKLIEPEAVTKRSSSMQFHLILVAHFTFSLVLVLIPNWYPQKCIRPGKKKRWKKKSRGIKKGLLTSTG